MKNKRISWMKFSWLKKKEIWVLFYVPVYLLWFFALEQVTPEHPFIVTNPLDRYIPFCEYFIVPYLLWFPYLIGGLFYFYRKEKECGFFKLAGTLIVGLTACLIIYTIFPNAQNLRVAEYPHRNIFTTLVRMLQQFDTPTNVCPSIHVFSTVAVQIAVMSSERLKKERVLRGLLCILALLICLSTVFLKQHSVTDMFCAFVVNAVLYFVFYRKN